MAKQPKKFLHIEAGEPKPENIHKLFRTKEWTEVRVDSDTSLKPQIIGTLMDLSNVPDNYADGVWFAQKLQYYLPKDALHIMKEVARVLKPNGMILTSTVDAQHAIDHAFNGQIMEPIPDITPELHAQDLLYGKEGDFKNCYTAYSFGRLLQAADLQNVQVSRDGVYLWAGAEYMPRSKNENTDKIRVNDHHLAHNGPPDDLRSPPKQWALPEGLKEKLAG